MYFPQLFAFLLTTLPTLIHATTQPPTHCDTPLKCSPEGDRKCTLSSGAIFFLEECKNKCWVKIEICGRYHLCDPNPPHCKGHDTLAELAASGMQDGADEELVMAIGEIERAGGVMPE